MISDHIKDVYYGERPLAVFLMTSSPLPAHQYDHDFDITDSGEQGQKVSHSSKIPHLHNSSRLWWFLVKKTRMNLGLCPGFTLRAGRQGCTGVHSHK